MTPERDLKDADFLKTHRLHVSPEGELIPVVFTKSKHPLTAVREKESIFVFYMHISVAKRFLRCLERDIKKAEGENHDYAKWWLTGEIYLPK